MSGWWTWNVRKPYARSSSWTNLPINGERTTSRIPRRLTLVRDSQIPALFGRIDALDGDLTIPFKQRTCGVFLPSSTSMYHEGENNEQASKNHVIGSFNTHLASRTPRMPITGETILGGPLRMGPAGQGASVPAGGGLREVRLLRQRRLSERDSQAHR